LGRSAPPPKVSTVEIRIQHKLWRSTTRIPVYKDLLTRFIATIKLLLMIKHVTRFSTLLLHFNNRYSHGPERLSTLLAIGYTSGVRFIVGENKYIRTHTIPGPKEKTGP